MTTLYGVVATRAEDGAVPVDELHPTQGSASKRVTELSRQGYDCEQRELVVSGLGRKELLSALYNRHGSAFASVEVKRSVPGTKAGKAEALRQKKQAGAQVT